MRTESGLIRSLSYEEMQEGGCCEQEYQVSAAVYNSFLAAFGDLSPIHVDDDYARSRGFAGKVMHGAILNGFLSHFVGTRFPGKHGLLLTSDLRFSQPTYLDDRLRLRAVVTQKADPVKTVVLDITFFNETRQSTVATGRVRVRVESA